MKFKTKVRLMLHFSWLQKGLALTNYVKYLIAFFGLATQDATAVIALGLIYALASYLLGYLWFKHMVEAETEVGNMYNKFVKEMRKKYKK